VRLDRWQNVSSERIFLSKGYTQPGLHSSGAIKQHFREGHQMAGNIGLEINGQLARSVLSGARLIASSITPPQENISNARSTMATRRCKTARSSHSTRPEMRQERLVNTTTKSSGLYSCVWPKLYSIVFTCRLSYKYPKKKRLPFSYGYLALFAPILEDPSEQAMCRSYETKKCPSNMSKTFRNLNAYVNVADTRRRRPS